MRENRRFYVVVRLAVAVGRQEHLALLVLRVEEAGAFDLDPAVAGQGAVVGVDSFDVDALRLGVGGLL